MKLSKKNVARVGRKGSVRKGLSGTPTRPRLTVYRSNVHIYAQIIDDEQGKTLVSASSCLAEIKGSEGAKKDIAKKVGAVLGQRALDAGVSQVVFDRNGFQYHGRVAALAAGARESGLSF